MRQTTVPECHDQAERTLEKRAVPSVGELFADGHPGMVAHSSAATRYAGQLTLRVVEFSSPEGVGGRTPTMAEQGYQREHALDAVRSSDDVLLIVPPYAEQPIRRALVAVDFSRASARAAVAAVQMTERHGRVSLVHVESTTRHVGGRLRADAEAEYRNSALFAQFVALLPDVGKVRLDTVMLSGDSVGALLRYAEEQEADLIACGVRRRGPGGRRPVGRLPTSLIRGAPCCVMIVPEDLDFGIEKPA